MMENTLHNCRWQEKINLIDDKSVNLIVTDPPYDIEISGRGMLKDKKRIQKTFDKMDSYSGQSKFDYDAEELLINCQRILKKFNGYFFTDKKTLYKYLNFAIRNNYNYSILLWRKLNPLPFRSNNYLPDYELVVFIREKGAYFNSNADFQKYYSIQTFTKNNNGKSEHPNSKPLQLIKNYIEISSKPGDTVIDTFAGSGTTLIGAKQLERNFIGFEVLKKWYQLSWDNIIKTDIDTELFYPTLFQS